MARITVEDCVTVVPNRFELCLVAGTRAKAILVGSPTTLDKSEKPPVIALREIADQLVDIESLRKTTVRAIKNRGVVDIGKEDEAFIDAMNEEGGTIAADEATDEVVFLDESPEELKD